MPDQTCLEGLTIVIPALNEAKTIQKVVREALEVGSTVVVVDDGSKDDTGKVAKEAGARIVRHESPNGYDAAVSAGLNFAFAEGAKAAVTCDADGQHRMEDVRRVSECVMRQEYDYCAGIRNHYNRPIEAVLGIFSFPLFGTPDPFCGLRCYHRRVFEKVGKFPREMNVGTLPMAWLKKFDLRSIFIPIEVRDRMDKPRFGNQLKASWLLLSAFSKSVRQRLSL